MTKGLFDGLSGVLNTELDTKPVITKEHKTLETHHMTIAENMVEDFDNHKTYVEKEVQYPFIEIKGPTTAFEIQHIKRDSTNEDSLPLMINVGGVYSRLGTLELNYENIIDLLSIAEYTLILHETKEESSEIAESLILTLLLT